MRFSRADFIAVVLVAFLAYVFIEFLLYVSPEQFLANFLDSTYIYALCLSLATATIASIVAFPLSVFLGYFLSREDFVTKGFLEVVFMIPYSIPPISLGSLLLLFFTISKVGVFIERIFSVLFSFKALLIVHFILSFSVMVFFIKNAFTSISKEFEDFARILGYGRIRSLLIILIPMMRNQLLYAYIMGFMRAFTDFGASIMVAGAIISKTATLPSYIYIAINSGDIDQGLIATLTTVVISMTIISILQYRAHEKYNKSNIFS